MDSCIARRAKIVAAFDVKTRVLAFLPLVREPDRRYAPAPQWNSPGERRHDPGPRPVWGGASLGENRFRHNSS
jgi:hypothetical protein